MNLFEYFEGFITAVNPGYLVMDVNGVGYKILTANPFRYEPGNEKQKIYVYQAVRENEMTLFGFANSEEKQLFEQLLNVSGIGPKSALAILANEDHHGLIQAIGNNDVSYLVKFPGIGKKTAQQIVLDLKDKLVVDTNNVNPSQPDTNRELADALEALEVLGYGDRDTKKIAKQLSTGKRRSTNEYLSMGLKLLAK